MEILTQHELPAVRAVAAPPAKRSRGTSSPPSRQMEFLSDERGLYVRLPLTRGMSTVIDFYDLALVNAAGTWSAMWNGALWYVKNSRIGYLHRFLTGAPAGMLVDHHDLDGLNNRRWNLRVATRSQNGGNTIKRRCEGGTSSRYKGVDLLQGRYWRAQVVKDRQRHHLGLFGSEEEAALAYDAAARELHGEFARLNFPEVAA
jgi:transposase InsO family protein